MAQAQGTSAVLAYQEETTYGTVPASVDMKKLPFISGSPKQSRALITSKVLSTDRNPRKAVRGAVEVSASIPTELSPQMGTIFKGALGANTPAGGGSPYTHTIKVAATLPSFMFEIGYTDIAKYLIFMGMKINKLSINVKPDGMQDMTIDLMGMCECEGLNFKTQSAAFTVGATLTGATSTHTALIIGQKDDGTTGKLVLFNHSGDFQNDEVLADDGVPAAAVADGTIGTTPLDASVTDPGHTPFDGFSISYIKEGGSTIAIVSSIDALSIENNLDGGNYVIGGGGRRRSIPAGSIRVSGTLNALFESMDVYHKASRYTESSLEIYYKLGTGAGTAGNEQLKIYIPELVYAPNSPEVPGPQGIMVKLPFEAYYNNDAAASAIWMELKNQSATL